MGNHKSWQRHLSGVRLPSSLSDHWLAGGVGITRGNGGRKVRPHMSWSLFDCNLLFRTVAGSCSCLKLINFLNFKLETNWAALYSVVCESVRDGYNTWPNLHFFQYIQAKKPFDDPVLPNTKQYQLILTQYHQVPASNTVYWSSTIKYQLI